MLSLFFYGKAKEDNRETRINVNSIRERKKNSVNTWKQWIANETCPNGGIDREEKKTQYENSTIFDNIARR